jgi:hypothetical protein
MVSYPISVQRKSYRGRKESERRRCQAYNEDAALLERIVNEMIEEQGPGTYLYYQIADRARLSVERVYKILFSVDCGSNGFTIYRGADGTTIDEKMGWPKSAPSEEVMLDPFDDVRDTVYHARLCCEAWWQLEGAHPHRDAILRGFESFSVLFETIRPALFVSFIVKICSLFGNGRDEITLRSLPDAQLDPEFARIWDTGRIFYRYRSKLIAHRDASKDPDLVAKETGMTHDDLLRLMNDVVALFDRVAAVQRVPSVPDVHCEDEILEVARRLLSCGN